MDSEVLIETLEDAGLSPYQADAYVTTLELGTASATEIADASDVPTPRIYDVLESLAERGYVETYEQASTRARAHSPADVLDDLRGRAERFEAAAAEIEDRWEQPELETNEASIVKRFQTVVDRAELFIQDAENQVHLSVTPREFEHLRDTLRDAHERGVAVHVSIHTDLGEAPPTRDRFVGICKEARHRELPTAFIALIDRKKTCFARNPDSFDQYGVLVNDQTHTFVFHWYFMTCLWEHSSPVYSERNPEPPIEYVDIRHLVREMRGALDAEATMTVRVEGVDVETGDAREVTGTVEKTRHVAHSSGEDIDPELAGEVMLLVDTGEETVSVGGWDAVVEDIEATRIVVEAIDRPDAVQMRTED